MSFRFDTISLEKTTVQLARRSSNPLKKKNTPDYTSLKQKEARETQGTVK
jgi:hypothetical protein